MIHDPIAYAQGQAAFLDGYGEETNEYQHGTQLHEDWLAGWDHEYQLHAGEVAQDAFDRVLDDPRRGQARDINRRMG